MALQVYYIANAMQSGPRVGRMDMEKRVAGLTVIIARLYSLKSMGGDKQALQREIALAVSEMEKEIAMKCPFMTMAEIQYALESGVKGELDGDPTILSVANYCKWLAEYRNSDARKEGIQAIENGKRVEVPALPVGDVLARNEAVCENLAKELFAEVKATGHFGDHYDVCVANVYNYLRKKGRMEKPSAAEIQAAFHEAAKYSKKGEGAPEDANRAKRILLEKFMLKHV